MSLEEYARKFLEDPDADAGDKKSIQALMTSHLATGQRLAGQGLFREAILEYEKEHVRPIESSTDAEIVQASYFLKGRVYRKLGEHGNALVALQKAREILRQYHVGSWPHEDLAEILLEQKRPDEAIAVCQELLNEMPSWRSKKLLETAIAMKGSRTE